MAISSVAEKRARYGKMLVNWVVGIAILFLLHYFMVVILNVNEALVKAIEEAVGGATGSGETSLTRLLFDKAVKINIIRSTTAAICLLMLTGITFGFLINYIKRMLTIALLTFIAPLVCITYAADKVGDGRSQILNAWIKEYTYNVIIQPFHCIIYIVFVQNAVSILYEANSDFIAIILAIMCMSFLFIAETIVKGIFNIKVKNSAVTSVTAAAAVAAKMAAIQGNLKHARETRKQNVNSQKEMKNLMPKTENKLPANATVADKAKNVASKAGNAVGKAGNIAKKVYLNPKFTGIQTAMIAGALGLATGSSENALNSARTGKAAGESLGARISQKDKQKQVERNERTFEKGYDEYQIANPDENMTELTDKILSGGSVSQSQKAYQAYVMGMKSTYTLSGMSEADAIQAVKDKVAEFQMYE